MHGREILKWLALVLLASGPALAQSDVAAQRALVEAAVAAFAPQVDGTPEVYFLGFAGVGEERVFAEEVRFAAARVAERYGSAARTLLLVNDRRDLDAHPRASGVALGVALKALGRVMNPHEDVLFLVFSSHGGEGATLEVSNTGVPPRGLAADDVAVLLRESGIRWQVVVVSACFSGGFIGPLASDERIVLTAAARNRASFGCSDDRDLTYFGEAFFRDALPGAASLRAAFEASRQRIRERERAERIRASRPQSHFGPLMEAKLAELEAGLPTPPHAP